MFSLERIRFGFYSPANREGGKGVIVKTVVLTMKWNASYVHKTGIVYILENQLVIYTLEAKNTCAITGPAPTLPS